MLNEPFIVIVSYFNLHTGKLCCDLTTTLWCIKTAP